LDFHFKSERLKHLRARLGSFAKPRLGLLLALLVAGVATDASAAISSGSRTMSATVAGTNFTIYTYKPSCTNPSLAFIHHGTSRDAEGYRDSAIDLAKKLCMVVVAPLFDEDRFSSDNYQRGGIVDGSDRLRSESQWTTRYIEPMIAWARAQEGRADMPVFIYGHSAGGQFVSRVAAYERIQGIARYVVANPSTHVRGSLNEDPPYGFRDFPDGAAALREYLALPLTVYLGGADTVRDSDLATGSDAEEQGRNRLARGEFVFAEAQKYAKDNGLAFNWRKVIAPGVSHTNGGMLRSSAAPEAFRVEAGTPKPVPQPDPDCPVAALQTSLLQ
jgi:poly(3-hydroxybutyrate) depolymerase